jgi:hypothetical protein
MAARSFGMILVMLGTAFAQTRSVGQQGCITDLGRIICSPPGGVVVSDLGQILCGRGQCVTNLGRIVCSRQAAGYAAVNEFGQTVCTGGCESASPSYC